MQSEQNNQSEQLNQKITWILPNNETNNIKLSDYADKDMKWILPDGSPFIYQKHESPVWPIVGIVALSAWAYFNQKLN